MKKKCLKLTNMNYSTLTLGELLSSENETIKRNAVSILRVLQKKRKEFGLEMSDRINE